LLTGRDLQQALCGSEELDFVALKSSTKYEDYTETSDTIIHFWQIVQEDLDIEQKKAFLKFLTGSEKAPIEGLKKSKITISRHGPDSESLPSSHTCFNHLLLPDYKNYEKLKCKLFKSIENCEGFGLF
jgi:ubiquitin-protein ligase E3 A